MVNLLYLSLQSRHCLCTKDSVVQVMRYPFDLFLYSNVHIYIHTYIFVYTHQYIHINIYIYIYIHNIYVYIYKFCMSAKAAEWARAARPVAGVHVHSDVCIHLQRFIDTSYVCTLLLVPRHLVQHAHLEDASTSTCCRQAAYAVSAHDMQHSCPHCAPPPTDIQRRVRVVRHSLLHVI